MKKRTRSITILMADDDADDRMMTKEAFEENHLANDLRFVQNGVELMDYLKRRGQYSDPSTSPRPGLILLDLNMPKKDGREALAVLESAGIASREQGGRDHPKAGRRFAGKPQGDHFRADLAFERVGCLELLEITPKIDVALQHVPAGGP